MKLRLYFLVFVLVVILRESYSQDLQSPTRTEQEQLLIDEFGEKLVATASSNHPDLSIA